MKRFPKAEKRFNEDEDNDDIPSDAEVASVVGGYDEDNDEIF